MKKKYIILMLLVSSSVTSLSNPIDLDKAYRIAEKFASGSGGFELAFKGISKKGKTTDKNAPLYIFNRGNDEGFVIVSGDDCLPEVLGYTEKGNYCPDSLPPHLLDWIEGYSIMIETAQENNVPSLVKTRNTVQKQSVAPLITAHWNQTAPYNNLCPYIKGTTNRALTGCVATAASQVAYYWRKENPERTLMDTPTYDYGDAPVTESTPAGTPYHWNLMRDWYDSSTPQDMNMAVANLMVVIGTTNWLTYGYSTSGWTKNLVETYKKQLNLDSKATYKMGIDQQIWEDMIYEELIMGRPMVYCGQVPNGGAHAVVLDGYDANTNLYHFDFGWGGSGNGYYTVNDINGMNGFSAWQGMTYGVHPAVNSLNGKIRTNTLYTQMHNDIEFEVTNSGTASYKGLYLFISSKQGAPSDLAKAKMKNLATIIKSGETAKLSYSHRIATSLTPQYVYLTDDNLMILDSIKMEVMEQASEYTLEGWTVKGKKEEDVTHVYRDSDTELLLSLSTPEESTPGFPRIQCVVYEYDNNENSYKEKYKKTVEGLCKNGVTTELTFMLDNLEKDVKYKAELITSVVGSNTPINTNGISPETEFILKGETLRKTEATAYRISLDGDWDEKSFRSIMDENSDSIVCVDLRQVNDVNGELSSLIPNTLFYTDGNAVVEGANIICNGVCKRLELTPGHDFAPIEDFMAEEAVMTYKPESTEKWIYLTVPFTCPLPDGVIARKITSMTGVSINGIEEIDDSLEAGIPYLVKFSTTGLYAFTAENVNVTTKNNSSNENIGITYINIKNERRFRALNNESTQKFALATFNIPAFSGYLDYGYDVSTRISSLIGKDNALKQLSEAISTATQTVEKFESLLDDNTLAEFLHEIDNAKKVFTSQCETEEITEVGKILSEKTELLKENIVLLDETVDLTDLLLQNHSFESKRTTGWDIKREIGQLSYVRESSNSPEEYMIDVDTDCYFHTFSSTGKGSVTISQDIENIPDGYYMVEALVAADENEKVTLFANDSSVDFTGDDMGGRYFHRMTIDSVYVENGLLTIGASSEGDEYKADGFRLVYRGTKDGTTDIKGPKTEYKENIKVWSDNGCIIINSNEKSAIKIYSIDGLLIKDFICHGYTKVSGIPEGIYIVNGKKLYVTR